MGRLDDIDRRIMLATQAGLPLVARPYHAVAEKIGVDAGEVMQRIERMRHEGVIRRIGAVPNHYVLGYRANGMTVWDVADEAVDAAGERVGALPFVTHCYRRPRRGGWRYNLFAMVHARSRAEVEECVAEIGALIGPAARARDVLYSVRILKKTGVRFNTGDQVIK
ncbi:MAG: AsnC family transcriptional regulator [Betaproteobacteria bacterium]|nr:AsnC family transcriptional regulator [Betaproteobacteria bacterium]